MKLRQNANRNSNWKRRLYCLYQILNSFGLIAMGAFFVIALIGVIIQNYFLVALFPLTFLILIILLFLSSVSKSDSIMECLPGILFALCFIYGLFSLMSPVVASYIVPNSWEWPMPKESQVLLLDSGKRVAATEDTAPRIQIYDASGKYAGGWFLPTAGGSYSLIGSTEDGTKINGQETVLVHIKRKKLNILYNLEGQVVSEAEAEYQRGAPQKGKFESMRFSTPWYKWPLIHLFHGWILIMGSFAIVTLAGFHKEIGKFIVRHKLFFLGGALVLAITAWFYIIINI